MKTSLKKYSYRRLYQINNEKSSDFLTRINSTAQQLTRIRNSQTRKHHLPVHIFGFQPCFGFQIKPDVKKLLCDLSLAWKLPDRLQNTKSHEITRKHLTWRKPQANLMDSFACTVLWRNYGKFSQNNRAAGAKLPLSQCQLYFRESINVTKQTNKQTRKKLLSLWLFSSKKSIVQFSICSGQFNVTLCTLSLVLLPCDDYLCQSRQSLVLAFSPDGRTVHVHVVS